MGNANLVVVGEYNANKVAQYLGYKDAHDFKDSQRYRPPSRYDIAYDRYTNDIYVIDKSGNGESVYYKMPEHLK